MDSTSGGGRQISKKKRVYTPAQREAIRLYMVAYNARNRERHRKERKAYYQKNKEKVRAASIKWYYANRERVARQQKLRHERGGNDLRLHTRKLARAWYYRNHEANKKKCLTAALRRPLEKRRLNGWNWVQKNRVRYRAMVRQAAAKASFLLTDSHVRRELVRKGIKKPTPAQIQRKREQIQNRRTVRQLQFLTAAKSLCKI